MKKCWNVILVWLQMVMGGAGSVCSLLYELLPLHKFLKMPLQNVSLKAKTNKNWFIKIGLSASPDRARKPLVIARSISQLISLWKKCNVPERFLSYLNVNKQMASLHVTVYLKFRSSLLLQIVLSHHQVKLISVLAHDPNPIDALCQMCALLAKLHKSHYSLLHGSWDQQSGVESASSKETYSSVSTAALWETWLCLNSLRLGA